MGVYFSQKATTLDLQGIDHRLATISDPQVHCFHFSSLEIIDQVFSGISVLPISCGEAQYRSLTGPIDAHHSQNGHFVPLAIVDDAEIGSIRKGVHVMGFQSLLFSDLVLALQGVEDFRHRRKSGLRARQGFKHLAHTHLAHPLHKHITNRLIQFSLSLNVA